MSYKEAFGYMEPWRRIWAQPNRDRRIAMKAYIRVHGFLPPAIPQAWYDQVLGDELLTELGSI